MNKKVLSVVITLGAVALPVLALAAGLSIPSPQSKDTSVAALMENAATAVWYIFAGVAIIMFLIAGVLFLTANGSPEKIGQARQAVIWGIVGVVVGLLAGGIFSFVSELIK